MKDDKTAELVRRAQNGDEQAVDELSQLAKDKLLPYIHRLTLNYDVAEDILQEILLHLVKSINNLKKPESFWCWIFRTAYGKVQHYYRSRTREQKITKNAFSEGWNNCADSKLIGYNYVIRKELSETIIQLIARLSINQRTVLALRCYEGMPYSEIADIMHCKEMAARILFYRAKSSLKKDLVRRGFGREYLMLALGLFGAITVKSEAASATSYMSASLLNVGAWAVIVSTLSSRTGLITTSLVAAFGYLATSQSFYYVLGGAFLMMYVMFWVCLANIYKN